MLPLFHFHGLFACGGFAPAAGSAVHDRDPVDSGLAVRAAMLSH